MSPQSPGVSILLPVYQGMPYLEAAIDSVFKQDRGDWELIVGDDGSEDGSQRVLASLDDPRIRVIPGAGPGGLFANLNRLIPHARAPWVRIFCQDDVLKPHALSREMEFAARYPQVGFFFCKADALGAEGKVTPYAGVRDLPSVLPSELAVQHFFYHGCIPGNLSTVTVARRVLQSLGGFDSSLRVSGDYALWAKISTTESVGVLAQSLVQLRAHPRRLSHAPGSLEAFIIENQRIRQFLRPHLPQRVMRKARQFEVRRHRVLDWHCALKALVGGQLRTALGVWKTFSPWEWVGVALYWGLTGNNRWYRPQAPWVHPTGYHQQMQKDLAEDQAAG